MNFLLKLYAREPILMVNFLVAALLVLVQELDLLPILEFVNEDNAEPFVALGLAAVLGRGRVYSPATVEGGLEDLPEE